MLEGAVSTRPAVGLLQLAADSEMDPFIEDGKPNVFVVVTGRGSTIGDMVGPDRFAVVCILTCAIACHCNKQIIMRRALCMSNDGTDINNTSFLLLDQGHKNIHKSHASAHVLLPN